jgi:hypothetical protein
MQTNIHALVQSMHIGDELTVYFPSEKTYEALAYCVWEGDLGRVQVAGVFGPAAFTVGLALANKADVIRQRQGREPDSSDRITFIKDKNGDLRATT